VLATASARVSSAPTASASRRCCGCWPGSTGPIAARWPPARGAHRLAAPGGAGRAHDARRVARGRLGELWTVRGELQALLARLAQGDTSPGTLERYGHEQERFEALGGWAVEASLDEARRALAIDHLEADTPLARLSGGEQARALLAGTLLAAPTALLLDEPTNHLDGEGLQWLEDWLRDFPGTVVVVSHDRAFLDAVVGCVLELEPGGALTRYEGGYSDHRAEREARRAKLALDYEAQEKRRRRFEADIATTRRQAQHTERTVSRAAAPKLKRYAKKVARKAKAREGRLRRELEGDRAVTPPVQRAARGCAWRPRAAGAAGWRR
jgi:ATPase subunit of ABC transporter with duplicated ATPase domains